jgi:AraC-like DNA-binding protein
MLDILSTEQIVVTAPEQDAETEFAFPGGLLLAVQSGNWSLLTAEPESPLSLSAGDVLLTIHEQPLKTLPASGSGPWRLLAVQFQLQENALPGAFTGSSPLFLNRQAFAPDTAGPPGEDLLKLMAGILVATQWKHLQSDSSQPEPVHLDPEIAQAIQAIQTAPGKDWTIQRLASEVGISRSALAQKFKAQTGQTPNEYLLGVRMKIAEGLLRSRRQHLKEIARQAGYQSVSAFSTAFKRWSGTSPSLHRRRPLE